MADVTLNCGFGCSSVDGCRGHCENPAIARPPITPGPWDWAASSTFSANGGFHLYLIDSKGRKIAALWGKEEEKAANAVAISTLPDLLASLEWIAGHDATANGLTGFAAELLDSLTAEARSALSKALSPAPSSTPTPPEPLS